MPDVYSLSDAPEVAQMVGFKMEVISDRRGGNKSWGKCSPLKLRGGSLCGNPQSALNRASVKLLNFLSPARARMPVSQCRSRPLPLLLPSTGEGGREHLHKHDKAPPSLFPESQRPFCAFSAGGKPTGTGKGESRGRQGTFVTTFIGYDGLCLVREHALVLAL